MCVCVCVLHFPADHSAHCPSLLLSSSLAQQFSTNGTILKDEEMGEVIQIQGDRRKDAMEFLVKYKICEKDEIKVHGF